jgi:hypothetical protein
VDERLTVGRAGQALARRIEWQVVRPLRYGPSAGKPRAHFMHVGKAGGTAVKEALAPHRRTGRYDLLLHDHPFSFGDALAGEKVFCILRDPVERFVSAFNYRRREGRPHQYAPWTEQEARAYTAFASADELGRALSAEDPDVLTRARSAMLSIRHVRDSYWRWFDSSEYLERRLDDVLLILWLPDLDTGLTRLLDLLGLPPTITIPGEGAKANRSPAPAEDALSPEAITNLRLWYGADYGLIEYCATLPCFAGPSYDALMLSTAQDGPPLGGGHQ